MPSDPGLLVMVVSSALAAALLAAGLLLLPRAAGPRRGEAFVSLGDGIVFLFDGPGLIDATPRARAMLAGPDLRGPPQDRLRAALARRFPTLDAALARLPADGAITLTSTPGGDGQRQVLRLELAGGLTRVELTTGEAAGGPALDVFCALSDEVADLRAVASEAPLPIWREAAGGEVVWANTAYVSLVSARLAPDEDLAWPLPALFPPGAQAAARRRLEETAGAVRFFDLVERPLDEGRLCFALPADATERAEAGLRDFMQTLVRTFAHLPVGLAIFDRHGQMQLFNPAFLDLTGLPADVLSARPRLATVLDLLRDRSMLPEPKDYHGWRRRLAGLERARGGEQVEETWSLPGGQTYRVTARPHADGGLAVMIEDISTEMSRTRRYRADLELGQSVIDALPEAIAVFSPAGQLVMSNECYGDLWGADLSGLVAEAGILSLSRQWRGMSPPSPVWDRIEDFVVATGARASWTAEVRLLDGRLISCRIAPLAGGATLAAFRVVVPGEAALLRPADALTRRA